MNGPSVIWDKFDDPGSDWKTGAVLIGKSAFLYLYLVTNANPACCVLTIGLPHYSRHKLAALGSSDGLGQKTPEKKY